MREFARRANQEFDRTMVLSKLEDGDTRGPALYTTLTCMIWSGALLRHFTVNYFPYTTPPDYTELSTATNGSLAEKG